jgi:hypothetical protein
LSAWPYDVEPDKFSAGAVLTNVVPGVTLTVVGEATSVTALVSDRHSTGSLAFGHGSVASDNKWMSSYQSLRIEFTNPVDAVALDFINTALITPREWGMLQAYDANGNQLAFAQTSASGSTIQTLILTRPRADIKYCLASGIGLYTAVLDNLVVGNDKVDVYALETSAGSSVQLRTRLFGDGPREPENSLDPRLEVYDASGTLVASDDNSAPDFRNAALTFTAGAGPYTVKVSGRGSGVYGLQVSGATVVNPVPSVALSTPAEQGVVAHAPQFIDITFTEAVRADQLAATVLVVEGKGAASAARLRGPRPDAYGHLTIRNVHGIHGPYLPEEIGSTVIVCRTGLISSRALRWYSRWRSNNI